MAEILNYTNNLAAGVGAVLEALVLFWFFRPLKPRWKSPAGQTALCILAAALMTVLHYQYYQFLV